MKSIRPLSGLYSLQLDSIRGTPKEELHAAVSCLLRFSLIPPLQVRRVLGGVVGVVCVWRVLVCDICTQL